MSPLGALQTAVCALLEAERHSDAARLLGKGELLLAGEPESWTMGSRVVAADRVVLLLDPAELALARAEPALLEQIRDALDAAMRSTETRLRGLDCCLRLPVVDRPWRDIYRSAPRLLDAAAPDADAVLGAAEALLRAAGDEPTAQLLGRCELEIGDVAVRELAAGARRVLRCVLRLPAEALRELRADRARADAVRAAITDAATRPLCAVGDVTFAALGPP
jgi:hypothetical protein